MEIIGLKGITQYYGDSNTPVIQDLNLSIQDKPDKGQFIMLLGASGCGKSTILRYISGLQKPTSGTISLYGKPRTREDRVSMVFQKYSSFPWMSVLDNVALGLYYQGVGKKERQEKAMEWIETVGLKGHEHKYAKYPILSGGQLQRVAIARSLVANSDIILMDEPFGALDINTRLKMQDTVMEIWQKVKPTIVFITHDISEAVYLGDEIYIMAAGPGRIAHHIPLDHLPFLRNKSTKREKKFIDTVHQVEDLMVQIHNSSPKQHENTFEYF